jgi:hypothetical protein
MNRLRQLGLSLKLATAGGRSAWTRLVLVATGFAIGSALLLAAASIAPGVHALDERRDIDATIGVNPNATNALRVWRLPQSFGDLDVSTSVVAPIGRGIVPPGLPRVPGPGDIFASERLVSMWPTLGPAIEHRLDGHLAGTIGRDGVIGPDSLTIWEGKPKSAPLERPGSYRTTSFGSPASATPLDVGWIVMIVVVASTILLPIWLFVGTVTRLSAATREARLAAVRLAGATQRQVRFFAATEAGVAAALGTWLGIPLFLLIRPALAAGPIGGLHMYPTDLAPPLAIAIVFLVGLPALAIGMALASLRRVVVSPLGVSRGAKRSHAGWRWVIVLGFGIAVLTWSASKHRDLKAYGDVATFVLVGGSLAAICFGLIGTATWSAWAIAHKMAASVRTVPAMLGFRRLDADPGSVSRVVGGVALIIALLGIVNSGLISAERSEGPPHLWGVGPMLGENDVGVERGTHRGGLATLPGVRSVTWTHKIPYGRESPPVGIVATDGSATTVEAIRDKLAWSKAEVHTLPEFWAQARAVNDDYTSFRRAALAITFFLLLVSAATMLVAMVDWLMERRRSLAVLSAVGVSNSTVRRSILVQVALPLVTSLAFGVGGALLITWLLYTAVETPVVFATGQLAGLVVAVCAIVLGITALSTPWLRIARNPELLREA